MEPFSILILALFFGVIGFLIGWFVEWRIDLAFWRQRAEEAGLFEADANVQLLAAPTDNESSKTITTFKEMLEKREAELTSLRSQMDERDREHQSRLSARESEMRVDSDRRAAEIRAQSDEQREALRVQIEEQVAAARTQQETVAASLRSEIAAIQMGSDGQTEQLLKDYRGEMRIQIDEQVGAVRAQNDALLASLKESYEASEATRVRDYEQRANEIRSDYEAREKSLRDEAEAHKAGTAETRAQAESRVDELQKELAARLSEARHEHDAREDAQRKDFDSRVAQMREDLDEREDELNVERRRYQIYVRNHPDHLNGIKGIGPKTEWLLHKAGINSFAELADSTVEDIRSILNAPKWRRVNPEAWIKQAATLAKYGEKD